MSSSKSTSVRLESFVKGLYFGVIQEDLVIPFPELDPEQAEELDLILGAFRRFAEEKIDPVAIDEAAEMPREVIDGLAEMGVFGLTIPDELGGLGISSTAYCKFMELVSRYCAATSATIGGHQSIGTKGIILFGTDEQKQRLLPRLATGEQLAAFALTEPQAGSDAAGLQATAVWNEAEGVYVLNGIKQWITNGGLCDVLIAFARTPHLGTTEKGRDISAFIIEMDSEGITRGKEEHKMGIKGSSTTEISFQNVQVPAANLLGKAGEGFKIALTVLNTGRLSLAAGCVGAAKKMLEDSIEHASSRQQFDTYLKDLELIQEKLADMAAMIYAMESTAYLTSGLADRGVADFACESAISKTFCSERLWDVVNHAVQINGGNGFIAEYPYERFLRDSRINMIFEGTNEIQRLFIAGQGLKAPAKALGAAGPAGTARFDSVPEVLRPEAALIEEGVGQLAVATRKVLQRYGRELPRQEFVLERIADATIDLYVMTACVARATSQVAKLGEEGAEREIDCTRLFCSAAARRIRRQWESLESNQDELVRRISNRACADGGYRASA